MEQCFRKDYPTLPIVLNKYLFSRHGIKPINAYTSLGYFNQAARRKVVLRNEFTQTKTNEQENAFNVDAELGRIVCKTFVSILQ